MLFGVALTQLTLCRCISVASHSCCPPASHFPPLKNPEGEAPRIFHRPSALRTSNTNASQICLARQAHPNASQKSRRGCKDCLMSTWSESSYLPFHSLLLVPLREQRPQPGQTWAQHIKINTCRMIKRSLVPPSFFKAAHENLSVLPQLFFSFFFN